MKYLFLFVSLLWSDYSYNHVISKNGMTITWDFIDDENIKFKVSSPSKGWLAIGLNSQNELVGSNLIMAAVSGSEIEISDRYVVGLGNHQAMESLGAKSQVQLISGKEDKKGTVVEFILKKVSEDAYHFDIDKNKQFYMTIAYSREDDFSHHSAMRTAVKIIF